jgi:hypothetical protein
MAEMVVDSLEVLQVRQQHRHDPVRPLGPRDLASEVLEEESAVVETRQRVRDRIDPQHREVALGEKPRLLQQSLAGVVVVQERRLEGQRPVQRIAERLEDLLDFLPAFLGFPGSVRDPGPVRQELPENLLPLAVPSGGRQGLAEPGKGEVPLPAGAQEPPQTDSVVSLFRCQDVSPAAVAALSSVVLAVA